MIISYQKNQLWNYPHSFKIQVFLNIPFAGHDVFEDQKEIFMISLSEFLKR